MKAKLTTRNVSTFEPKGKPFQIWDTEIPGFGELFRHISYADIGTSTVQSRAIGGFANNTLVFCMPGSTGACRTAWDGILKEQLDINFRPCNFAELLKKGGSH